jgi:hypothetical protein
MPGYGVQIYNGYNETWAHDNVVRNSRIHNNGGSSNPGGIVLGKGSNNQAYNNIIYDEAAFGGHCIDVDYNAHNSKVFNNTLYNCAVGIAIGDNYPSTSGVVVKNNIIYRSQYAAISDKSGKTTFGGNLCGGAGGLGCEFTGEPAFVDPDRFDFRLQSTSPAIDRGESLSPVTTDVDGKPRPQGRPYDAGAYEYTTGGTPSQPQNVRIVVQ